MVIIKVFFESVYARQQVLGIGCSHSKCPGYSGTKMTLVAQDSNIQNLVLTLALVDSEDLKNCQWFFSTL